MAHTDPRVNGLRAASRLAPRMPSAFRTALAGNRQAADAFAAFSPSHRREYVEWIAGAKQQATRDRRIAQAIEQITAGKSHHWKYQQPRRGN